MNIPCPRKRSLLLILALAAAGCGQDAEILARVGKKTWSKLEATTQGASTQLAPHLDAMRPAARQPTLAERVSYRLQWDQALAGAGIQVHESDGTIELRGQATSEEQRRRAVELAQSTTGVTMVLDSLKLPEPQP